MDILVMLEETPAESLVFAHVSSAPSRLGSTRPPRDVVRLYGTPLIGGFALALAAVVESHRLAHGATTIRHMGVLPDRGAVGDAAWRDPATGALMTADIEIPLEKLAATAGELLAECGGAISRLLAGLSMTDWPEGARRAISFSLLHTAELGSAAGQQVETILEKFREADAFAYDNEVD